jgi:hypothetical protein
MARFSMNTILNVPAEVAWKTIGDFNSLPKFIPAIIQSVIEGKGIGSTRTITLKDGEPIIERLEHFEEKVSKILSYTIVSSHLPVKNYRGVMQVLDLGKDKCMFMWSSSFIPNEVTEAEAVNLIKGIYEMGMDGLKKLYGG